MNGKRDHNVTKENESKVLTIRHYYLQVFTNEGVAFHFHDQLLLLLP